MARPQKQTVDFFPHYCNHGKTLYILEQKFGNNGYAFWFKLLEELGKHNGHFIDLSDEAEQEFFSAKTGVSAPETIEMLNIASKLKAIDPVLWEKRIVWCQHFVDNLIDVYAKRVVSLPEKPVSGTETLVSGVSNPQSRVEESRVVSDFPKKITTQPINPNPMLEDEPEIVPCDDDGIPLVEKPKSKANPEYVKRNDEFIKYYREQFTDEGLIPFIKERACRKMLNTYWPTTTLEEMKERLDLYFDTVDKFYAKNGYSLTLFLSPDVQNALVNGK